MSWEYFYTGRTPNPVAIFEQALLVAAISYYQQSLAEAIARSGGYELVEWVSQPGSIDPSWALYRDRTAHYLLTIAGTQSFEQFTQHLTGAIPLIPFPGARATIASHAAAAERLAEAVDVKLPTDVVTLDYSGHSYGGSVAQILFTSSDLPTDMDRVGNCLTFGAPRSFFGPAPYPTRGSCVRVSNKSSDFVAHIPPKGYNLAPILGDLAGLILGVPVGWTHFGYTVHLRADGSMEFVGKDVDDETTLEAVTSLSGGLSGHFITTYLRRLSAFFGGALYGEYLRLADGLEGDPGGGGRERDSAQPSGGRLLAMGL
jgi:hypothetical protein